MQSQEEKSLEDKTTPESKLQPPQPELYQKSEMTAKLEAAFEHSETVLIGKGRQKSLI